MAKQQASPRDRIDSDRQGETKAQRQARAAVQPGGYLWPELRVGRQASYESAYDWNDYINVLARVNRRRGHALPVGEMACHYVTDTEMRDLIMDKYNLPAVAKEARPTYNQIKRRLGSFIEDMRVEYGSFRVDPGDLDEHPELLGKTQSWHAKYFGRHAVFQACEAPLRDESSGGIIFLGKNKFGLDLSRDPMFNQERKLILNYLRSEEGLRVDRLKNDWTPHVTLFETKDHLSTSQFVMRWPVDMPATIELEPTKAYGE